VGDRVAQARLELGVAGPCAQWLAQVPLASPSGRKAAQLEAARKAVAVYGLPRDVDPHVALLEELHHTAGHVQWLQTLIGSFETPDQLKQYGGGEGGLLWERRSIWVELYQEERKRLVAVAKACIVAGVEERRVRLAEQQGQLIADAIRAILVDLGVADRPDAPAIVRRHLTLLGSGPPDVEQ
jgi:hypothetical protein